MQDLWLSVGHSRRAKTWKNVLYTWPQLVERLKQCHYTGETVKEYHAMDPEQQSIIKDVGGFVGGTITGGRRRKGAVTARSLITLDLDKPPVDFWDGLVLDWGCTMLLYSTHKHTPESPRLRLIIPMQGDVLTDQYEAMARAIAGRIGLEYFDPTTFQAERLMYWPSMPKDGQYLCEVQAGDWLDPADVLGWYKDWRDVSQWPRHPREADRVRDSLKVAPDPTEKPWVVGAFCRTYSIEDAIAVYLAAEYTPAGEGRYTYTGGSTAAGLVVYDDKFAYSHHGTDPAGGILCNAFDLVRLHKFGHLDDRCKEDTPIHRRPSFMAMADLARADSGVNLDLVKQQTARAIDVFAGDLGGGSDDWLKILETDRRTGAIKSTANNLLVILRSDDGLKGNFGLDLFNMRRMALGALPWAEAGGVGGPRPWADEDDAGLRWYLETVYGITSVSKIYDSLAMVMRENGFHPVREYLEGCSWDQVERLDTLLIDYFGAADNPYVRAVTRKTLVAAVARVMEPGCKFDTVLTLVGPQGAGKSTFISRLGGAWYSDSFRLEGKEAMENIQGVWVMELGELAGLKRADIEVVKHFLSKQYDDFRPAYGRNVVRYWRQGIFIASSNTPDFMQDQTGGRRFWPVPVGFGAPGIFKRMTTAEVKLIWGEAVEAWAADETLHLLPEIEALARAVQSEHTEKDGWEDLIRDYLEKLLPENWTTMALWDRKAFLRGEGEVLPVGTVSRKTITSLEIWREFIEGTKESFTTAAGRRISTIMRKMDGWEAAQGRQRIDGTRSQYYKRTDNDGL